ncbi:MAG: hypothetical protein IK053_02900, partial [Muribaculaceae bacterium]|nr:hypothetical protein [Muribaculaceae bacterium]
MNKRSASILCLLFVLIASFSTFSADASTLGISSPDGHLQLNVGIDRGKPFYSLYRDNAVVIAPSH